MVVEGGEGRLVCWGVEYPYSSLLPFIAAPTGRDHSCLVLVLVGILCLVLMLVGILCCVLSCVGVSWQLVLCIWWCVVYGLVGLVVVFGSVSGAGFHLMAEMSMLNLRAQCSRMLQWALAMR